MLNPYSPFNKNLLPRKHGDKSTPRNTRSIAPSNTSPRKKYVSYTDDTSSQVLERGGRPMLNPHHEGYKAHANCYEEERSVTVVLL